MFKVLSLAVMAWVLAAGARAQPVDYAVTPVVAAGRLEAVEISLTFHGDRDGRTEVRLPEAWSGADNLDGLITEVRADGAEVRRDGARLRLRHDRGAPVRLSYRIEPLPPPLLGVERSFRPDVASDGFTLIGWTVFARVEGRADQAARFVWGAWPEGWTLASDLDHSGGQDLPMRSLFDSVLVGGAHLSLVELDAGGAPVRVAVHGDWAFETEALAERYLRVVEASRAFWGGPAEPYLLAVTPVSGPPGARAQSGLGLGDGLAVWLSPGTDLDEAQHVLVHEQQHAWLPDRVGGLSRGPGEVMDFWFSEGVTDFYAYRTELRLGLLSPEAYLEELNRILARHGSGPTVGVGGQALARAFFSDRQAAGAPYERGLLLALIWDARLAEVTGGARNLDHALLAMPGGRGPAPARLIEAYAALGGGRLEPELDLHIGEGAPIRLPPDLFGDCAVIETDARGLQRVRPGASLSGDGRAACRDRLAGI